MNNKELQKVRRWNVFVDLNSNPYYCTTELAMWAEEGNTESRPDPRFHKGIYKRLYCGRCEKCRGIEENEKIDWKRKAFDLAKCYGESLKHIDELKVGNAYLKAENKMLFEAIKAGVDEEIFYISQRSRNFHVDITAIHSSSDPEHKEE